MRYLLLFCLLITHICFGASLQDQLYHFKTLSADIHQTMKTQDGQSVESDGHLWIQRPGKFRYEITQPNKQLFISQGKELYNYEEDLMQVIVTPLDKNLAQTPLLLLTGESQDLSALFDVKELKPGTYQFKPKHDDNLIGNITLSFDGDQPSQMTLTNAFGQLTTISFSNVELNQQLQPSLFVFNAPKGVDVLKQS